MRKMLRTGLLAGGLSLVALAPVGTAVAAAARPAGSGPAAATVLRDQDRLRLRDGSCQLAASVARDQAQDRLRLRDGSCVLRARSDTTTTTGVVSGARHQSGDLHLRTPEPPLDGTGLQHRGAIWWA